MKLLFDACFGRYFNVQICKTIIDAHFHRVSWKVRRKKVLSWKF